MIIIIPTRNRIKKLIKTLNFLKKNFFFFKKLIIVDSSDINFKNKIKNRIKKYNLDIKLINSVPSTSIQRNLGFSYAQNNKFIMFLDDDINFYSNAFKNMHNYLKKIDNKIVGISFNLIAKKPTNFFSLLKQNFIFDKIGFYRNNSGMISRSGWQTTFGNFNKNQKVEWMPTGAAIYRTKAIKKIRFEEKFTDYGYLEDLDFSIKLRKKGELMVCKDAKFTHDMSGDKSNFNFGKKEFINRFFIVKKYNFSKVLFFIVFFFRMIITLLKAFSGDMKYFKRFLGNITALLEINNLNKN